MQKIELNPSKSTALDLALSPAFRFYLYSEPEDSGSLISIELAGKIQTYFADREHAEHDKIGLLRLGLSDLPIPLPTGLSFWKSFAQIFIHEVCKHTQTGEPTALCCELPATEIKDWLEEAPCLRGIEYLNSFTIRALWEGLTQALKQELSAFNGSLEAYLATSPAVWNTVGRVCFHLAENKTNSDYPFAFMATYGSHVSKARAQHIPLGRALEEYAGARKQSLLLTLLLPLQKAAEKSVFLKTLIEDSRIFQPLAWTAREAHDFLKQIPIFEAAGIKIRVPNWWDPKKPARPKINITLGTKAIAAVGLEALLDFNMQIALPNGEHLSRQEFQQLLAQNHPFVQIKGQWVEVDSKQLNEVLSHWKNIEREVKQGGLSFAQGLRLLSGVSKQHHDKLLPTEIAHWSKVTEGAGLHEVLYQLRNPQLKGTPTLQKILKQHLNAQLRPYQEQGVVWLWWLYTLRLGGCLADDMGLGKTIQILSLLLLIKHQTRPIQKPHLLVLPASLIGNWQLELKRFAPSLRVTIVHSSEAKVTKKTALNATLLNDVDLVITTYATLHRLPWLHQTDWDLVILDEAQAIKNPGSKQTQSVKMLKSQIRLILTGTPVENRLLDLWSLFDFVAPGLLGSSRVFADYSKQRTPQTEDRKIHFHASVRHLVSPYILRRLKSDKTIINDLPDKTEMKTYCHLTLHQVGLYQQAVNELSHQLENEIDGIKRKGLVLSYLLRLKQICNHPNHWLGHGEYHPALSGKFLRLQELCEVIAQKQEKVLVFTQFREMVSVLNQFLKHLFGREGLSLDGQTAIKERSKRVAAFQQDQGPPFFVLSLKAGGTGLNLTAASHVIHFDRWWNPAVENQATDRAYRIGQKKNVLVHKLICQGTIEEKIDALMVSKKSLADEVIGLGSETNLTELSNAELIKMIQLDIHQALSE